MSEESPSLELDLNQKEAVSLYLIIDTAIDTFNYKAEILKEIQSLPPDQRPKDLMDGETLQGTINLNKTITKEAVQFQKAISEIIIELEPIKENTPTIILPPNFKKS
jgi:hypothetical protein